MAGHVDPDEAFTLLHRSGWSVGEVHFARLWQVDGTNGEPGGERA
jgi:hypothetical protein